MVDDENSRAGRPLDLELPTAIGLDESPYVSCGLLVDQCCVLVCRRHLVELDEKMADRPEEEGAESSGYGNGPLRVERFGEQVPASVDSSAEGGFQPAGQAAEHPCRGLGGTSVAQPDAAASASEVGLT